MALPDSYHEQYGSESLGRPQIYTRLELIGGQGFDEHVQHALDALNPPTEDLVEAVVDVVEQFPGAFSAYEHSLQQLNERRVPTDGRPSYEGQYYPYANFDEVERLLLATLAHDLGSGLLEFAANGMNIHDRSLLIGPNITPDKTDVHGLADSSEEIGFSYTPREETIKFCEGLGSENLADPQPTGYPVSIKLVSIGPDKKTIAEIATSRKARVSDNQRLFQMEKPPSGYLSSPPYGCFSVFDLMNFGQVLAESGGSYIARGLEIVHFVPEPYISQKTRNNPTDMTGPKRAENYVAPWHRYDREIPGVLATCVEFDGYRGAISIEPVLGDCLTLSKYNDPIVINL